MGLHLVLAARAGHLDADHRRFGDRGVGVEHLLDLEARDVLAAPADAVLDAVDVVQPAGVVEAAGVAGVEPQVPPRLDGLLGHVGSSPP